jgi:membrane protease YdiL (CAAX protease family)
MLASRLPAAYAAFIVIGALSHWALAKAQRFGVEQSDASAQKFGGTRHGTWQALERAMMMRQGGKVLLFLWLQATLMICGIVAGALLRDGASLRLSSELATIVAGACCLLGMCQALLQAGRAVQNDASARPFLSPLPISPERVIESKTRGLRLLLAPPLSLLLLLAVVAALKTDLGRASRVILDLISLWALADAAVGAAFLSTRCSSPSLGHVAPNQVLMLPLFATVFAPTLWTATTACIGLLAVGWQARRAAVVRVRWLDDASDDIERETEVWRALLAATAFFSIQALSHQLAATMIVVSPVIEEYFFRGWLQQAIAADLPPHQQPWAFVAAAFAFALAHFGSYGVPQLVLGLVAGALFASGPHLSRLLGWRRCSRYSPSKQFNASLPDYCGCLLLAVGLY